MRYPRFIQTLDQRVQLNNLLVNCDTRDQMFNGLFEIWLENPGSNERLDTVDDLVDYASEFVAPENYTLLSPYYFKASSNDPENSLKTLLTRTYTARRGFNYFNPFKQQA